MIFILIIGSAYLHLVLNLPRILLNYYFHFLIILCVCRASHLGLLYLGSLVVLLVYSILYGLTAKESRWLGAITSAAVIILGKLNHYVLLVCLFACFLIDAFNLAHP